MRVKLTGSILVLLCVTAMLIQPALGKEYPTKSIELVCAYAPGSSNDIMLRMIADIAPKYLGQPAVVVNKVGAIGSVAAADVISSKPDGHKLAMLSNIFFATTVKTQKIPFDPHDLTPVVNLVESKLGLIVRGDSPWKTLNDLLDYAKKNPGKLKCAQDAPGNSLHMNSLLVFRKAGVDVIQVFYKGASPEKLTALLGGHVDVATMVYGGVRDHVKAGTVRWLVSFSDRRYSDLPEVPCAAELGFPETAKLGTFFGLYIHKNTPEGIKETLFNTFKKIYEDPEFKKKLDQFGDVPRFGGPEFMMDTIKKAEEVGVPIIKELGLYLGK